MLFFLSSLQAPDESLELLSDLRTCVEKAQAKKSKKKKASKLEQFSAVNGFNVFFYL